MSNPEIGEARRHALKYVYPDISIDEDIYSRLFDSLSHSPPTGIISFSNSSGAIKDKLLKESLNPYYVETLLAEVGSHLEICLKYYFQGLDLSERLESTLLEINSRKSQLAANIELQDKLEANQERRAKVLMNQTRINRQSDDWVAHADSVKGILPLVQAEDKASRQALNNEQIQIDSLREKMNTAGNALNYKERISQLKALYDTEYDALYRKAYAASVGLVRVYGIDTELPAVNISDTLFQIRSWYANAMAQLESVLKYDHEFTIHIPLKSGIHLKDSEPLKAINTFATGLNKHYQLNISREMFSSKKHLRLRGYRLYARDHDQSQTESAEFIHCQVQIPNQRFGEGPAAAIPKQLLTVPFTKFNGSLLHPMHSGVHNFNPVGEWNIYIPAHSSYGYDHIPDDYYLEVTVAAIHNMGD